MSRRSLNATVVLSALALCACSVYGPGDLLGSDTFGGDTGHGGGSGLQGGSSGAGVSGGTGGRGGTGTGGSLSAGSGGKAMGGAGSSSEGGSSSTGGGSAGGSNPRGGSGTGGKSTTGGDDSGGSSGASPKGGSGGGGTATGGATTGGTDTGGSAPVLPPELIDDMEDGNQYILLNDKRNGSWYTAAGKDGTADPAPGKAFSMTEIVGTPGATDSTQALHFVGSGGTEWGVMAAFDFRVTSTPKVPYDASAYKGITFWVKAAAAAKIVVRIPIKDTTAEADGACVGTTKGCEDHYRSLLNLTTSWKHVTLLWSDFAQESWGFATTFAPTQLVSVQFVVLSAVAPATPPSADFLIDDIAFVP